MGRKITSVFLVIFVCAGVAQAQPSPVSPHGLSFTLDPSRTAPGTVEVEVGTSNGNSFDLPWIFKLTADSENFLFRNVEYAVVGSIHSDSVGVIVRRPFYRDNNTALAISPRVFVPLKGDSTPLPGLAFLASHSRGLHSLVFNYEVNAVVGNHRIAMSADYSRSLSASGPFSKISIFGGVLFEEPDGHGVDVSLGQGLVYRPRPNIEFELAIRQMDIRNDKEVVVLTGLIINFGHIR